MPQRPHVSDRTISFGPGLAAIPERLLLAHSKGEVLLIVGAGVSRDSGLPDFRKLTVEVYAELDSAVHSVISRISSTEDSCEEPDLSGLQDFQKAEVRRFQKREYDVVLGMLERRLEEHENAQSPVRLLIREKLLPDGLKPAQIHHNLMRLADRGGTVTIVTTNFDLLLENAARNIRPRIQTHTLGSIPRPTRRQEFNGVLHVHGALDRNPKKTSDLIISDRDFGEYYLRRRVVPDLIYDAARLFHLVLVGYSANDPPMRYLLNAVAADSERFSDLKERFVFVGMRDNDPVELADWRARGIIPIPYKIVGRDHSQLQRTLFKWAQFAMVNANRHVDAELKRIVDGKRADASDEQRDLFDHFIRRTKANERQRLSRLLTRNKAEFGWLDAITNVSQEH